MQRDYPELEGREIDYIGGEEHTTGIVIGCNYDIGVTVVSKSDKNHYLLCLVGPMSPNYPKKNTVFRMGYRKCFNELIRCIERGVYHVEINHKSVPTGGPPTAEFCAFGQ